MLSSPSQAMSQCTSLLPFEWVRQARPLSCVYLAVVYFIPCGSGAHTLVCSTSDKDLTGLWGLGSGPSWLHTLFIGVISQSLSYSELPQAQSPATAFCGMTHIQVLVFVAYLMKRQPWSLAPSSSCHCTQTADLPEICAEVSPQISKWPLTFSTGSSASCLPYQWKRSLQHSWKLQWGPQREPAFQTPHLTVRMQKFENLLM